MTHAPRRPYRIVVVALIALALLCLAPAMLAQRPSSLLAEADLSLSIAGIYGGGVVGMAADGDLGVIATAHRLYAVDLVDPLSPRYLGATDLLPGECLGVDVSGDVAYYLFEHSGISASYEDGWGVGTCDLSDPASPRLLARVTLGSERNNHGVTAFALRDGQVLLGYDGMFLIDVTDPSAIYVQRRIRDGVAFDNGPAVFNDNAVYALMEPMRVFDITNPQEQSAPITSLPIHGADLDLHGDRLSVLSGSALESYTITDTVNVSLTQSLDLGVAGHDLYRMGDTLAVLSDGAVTLVDAPAGGPLSILGAATVTGVGSVDYPALAQDHVGDLLILGDTARLAYVDISDPAAPEQIATYYAWLEGLTVNGDRVYTMDRRDLLALDASDPSCIVEVGRCEDALDGAADGSTQLFSVGDLVHVHDAGALTIVDVSEPTRPISVAHVSGLRSVDMTTHGGYAYLTALDGVGDAIQRVVVTLDLADPLAPSAVHTATIAAGSWGLEQGGMSVAQDRLYVTDADWLTVYDLSDPARPRLIHGPDDAIVGRDTRATVHGSTMLQVGEDAPLAMFDVSDLGDIRQTWGVPSRGMTLGQDDAYLIGADTVGLTVHRLDAHGTPGASATLPLDRPDRQGLVCRQDDLIYHLHENRLSVLRIHDEPAVEPTLAPTPVWRIALPLVIKQTQALQPDAASPDGAYHVVDQLGGAYKTVTVRDGLAYVGVGARVVILDVSDPADMQVVGRSEPLPATVAEIVLGVDHGAPGLAYVAIEDTGGVENRFLRPDPSVVPGGLVVLDVSDPTAMDVVGDWLSPYPTGQMAVSGDGAYCAQMRGGLAIVDLANPAAPNLVARVSGFDAYDVMVAGDWCYASDYDMETLVFGVRDPSWPICTYHAGRAMPVAVADGWLYALDRQGVDRYSLADPAHPAYVASATSLSRECVTIHDGLMIASPHWTSAGSVQILDVSDHEHPVTLYRDDEQGWTGYSAIEDDTAFFAMGNLGLAAVDISDPSAPVELSRHVGIGLPDELAVSVDGARAMAIYDVSYQHGQSNVAIIDLAQPDGMSLMGILADQAAKIPAFHGEHAYLASDDALEVYRLVAGVDPVGQVSYPDDRGPYHLVFRDDIVGVVHGLWTSIDISDPPSPTVRSTLELEWPLTAAAYAEIGDDLYSGGGGGLAPSPVRHMDLSNILTPTCTGDSYTGYRLAGGPSTDMAATAGYLLYAIPLQGLVVADASVPGEPEIVGVLAFDSPVNHVGVVGDKVHVSSDAGVIVLDASALPAKLVLHEYDTPGDARQFLGLPDGRLLVGDGYGGVVLLERATD